MSAKSSIALLLCLIPILASCGEQKQGEQKPVLVKEQGLVLTDEQMQFKAYKRNLPESDPLYSLLEIVEDGYKLIGVSEIRPNGPQRGSIAAPIRGQVGWGWKFTVKNKSEMDTSITVKYVLLDQDSFELAADTENRKIQAGETVIVQNTSVLPYEDALKVARSAWKVSTGKTAAYQSQVGGSKGRREEGMIQSVEIPTPQQEYGKQLAENQKQQETYKGVLTQDQKLLEESQAEGEKQRKAYWDSVEESKRQQEVSRRQLEKWDEQQKRFDQILTTWEEQQKQYQQYLDKLEKK